MDINDLSRGWGRIAFQDILRAADCAHGNFIAELFEAGALAPDEWDAANAAWERQHIPQLYRAAGL